MKVPQRLAKECGVVCGKELRQKQLADEMAKVLRIPKRQVRGILALMLEIIKKKIVEGYVINLYDFGVFRVRLLEGQINRTRKYHEKKGQRYTYSRLEFKPADTLKMCVSSSKTSQRRRERRKSNVCKKANKASNSAEA